MKDFFKRSGMLGRDGILLLIVITGLALVIYAQVWHYEFLEYDDDIFLTNNEAIQQGFNWQSVKWAFTTNHAALWFPFLWLSHIIDYHLFGMHSGWHHLHNLLLHWLNAILLLVVLNRMTGRIWASGMAALLFAVHPQHVESVAWVTERKDTLSTVFFFLTILYYHRYTLRPTRRRYLAVFLMLTLGLMTKPMLVTLPFILLLLDYWPLGRWIGADRAGEGKSFLQLLREKFPFFAVAIVMSGVTYIVGKKGGIVSDQDMVPLKFRFVNSLNSYYEYLRQFVWPNRLYAQYDFQIPLPTAKLALASGILVGISIAAVKLRKSHPYVLAGWLWYLGTLIPVLGLIQQGGHAMADRYTYISMIGISLLVIWGLGDIWKKFRLDPKFLMAMALCATVGLTWAARLQASYWRDTETLFNRTIQMDPENEFAVNKLGDSYKRSGRLAEAKKMYTRATMINPHSAHAFNNLAGIVTQEGDSAGAMKLYERALLASNSEATIHYNLGILLQSMGRLEEAAASYDKALELEGDHYDAAMNLSLTYFALGRREEAEAKLKSMLASKPDDPIICYNLACFKSRSGRTDRALHWLKKAVDLGFNDWDTLATDPDLANLRSTPGFLALGLPSES